MQILEVDKIMFKKFICMLLAFLMLLPFFDEMAFVYADEDDETQEKSDYEKCLIDKNVESCNALAGESQEKIKEIEKKIEEAQNSKEEAAALAQEFANEADSLQGEIDNLSSQIADLEKRIEQLQEQIAENESKVEALNTRVKNRMVESQKSMHFNGYLEFVLGSKSFSDMLSRVYGVKAILSKDQSDRNELLDVITQLNADKAELDSSMEVLDASYQEIVSKQAEYLAMKQFYEEEESRIQQDLDDMTEERDNIYESFDDLKAILKEIGVTVNTGFIAAVHNSWISSTVWNYSSDFLDGRWHLGVDYAASRGEQIHAPAGGIIIRAAGGCSDPGYLGSACGEWISGGGNQVYMMCEVDGKIYGFIFFHLNTIYVEKGDFVLQDEVIGLVGSSGSSTGPHCHIEMYYLGDGDLASYLSMSWNATFSVGRGRTAYNNRCYYDDGSYRQGAPCILNPEFYLPG